MDVTVFVLWVWMASVANPVSQWWAADTFTVLQDCKTAGAGYERTFKSLPNTIGGFKCLPAGTTPGYVK